MRMQVKLEIGHKASCRPELTTEGYTHDWTVFVRGSEGKDISHFVEKVVFHLHESFPRPKRAIKEPPFKLDACGYGSFELKIEICFKTKDEPRRVMFNYDLFLPLIGYPPVTNVRTEALTFTHPTEDFMKKLIKGGGLQISTSNGVGNNGISNGHGNISKDEPKEAGQKNVNVPDSDKSKKTKLAKPIAKAGVTPGAVVAMKRSPPSHDHTPGDGSTAKKKKKPSENSSSSSKSKHLAPVVNDKSSTAPLSLSTEVKDLKVKFKPIPPKEPEKKKDHPGLESSHKGKIPTHSSKGKDLKGHTEHAVPCSESKAAKDETIEHKTKIKKKGEKLEKKSQSEKEKKEKDKKIVDKVTIRRSSGDSWASTGSSCGLLSNVMSKNKALGKLLSEMSDDEEGGENLPTPFKRERLPVLPKSSPKSASKEQCPPVTEKASGLNSSKHKLKENKARINCGNANNSSESSAYNEIKENCTSSIEVDGVKKPSSDDVKGSSPAKSEEKNGMSGLPKKELYDLYEQITNCEESDNLQKVVDVIETTGLYKISDKTLEFDLCCLDKVTLRKIQKCLTSR